MSPNDRYNSNVKECHNWQHQLKQDEAKELKQILVFQPFLKVVVCMPTAVITATTQKRKKQTRWHSSFFRLIHPRRKARPTVVRTSCGWGDSKVSFYSSV